MQDHKEAAVTSVAHVDTGKNMTANATVATQHGTDAVKKAEEMNQIADNAAVNAELAKQKAAEAKAKLEKVK